MGQERLSVVVDCVLLVLAVAASAVSVAQPHGVARLLLVLAAACLVPGCALLTRLAVEDLFEAVAIAVGLGFSLESAGATVMVWTGWWHPLAWALVLLVGSACVLLLDVRRIVVTTQLPSSADARDATS